MLDSVWFILTVCLVGGFFAGAINTLAGNGSAITLGIMTDLLAFPPQLANGTNRVGLLAQGISSGFAFKKYDKLPKSGFWPIVITMLVGAIIGVILAVVVSTEKFVAVYRGMMVVMLLILLIKPERWVTSETHHSEVKKPIYFYPILFVLGIYGGFLQMGMGLFFMAVLVLLGKYTIMETNIIKLVAVTLYTALVLAIFAYQGLVDWKYGIIISVGQAIGGWVAARYGSKSEKANQTAYYLLVTIVILVLINQFFL